MRTFNTPTFLCVLILSALSFAALPGCDDDGSGGVFTLSDLSGTWDQLDHFLGEGQVVGVTIEPVWWCSNDEEYYYRIEDGALSVGVFCPQTYYGYHTENDEPGPADYPIYCSTFEVDYVLDEALSSDLSQMTNNDHFSVFLIDGLPAGYDLWDLELDDSDDWYLVAWQYHESYSQEVRLVNEPPSTDNYRPKTQLTTASIDWTLFDCLQADTSYDDDWFTEHPPEGY